MTPACFYDFMIMLKCYDHEYTTAILSVEFRYEVGLWLTGDIFCGER